MDLAVMIRGVSMEAVHPVESVTARVTRIWCDVLRVASGQEHRTFFELQGQSIAAVRIAARIEDELGIAVDVALLFDDPDLATFAAAVVRAGSAG